MAEQTSSDGDGDADGRIAGDPAALNRAYGPPRTRVGGRLRRLPGALRVFLPLALIFTGMYAFGGWGWTSSRPQSDPEFGVNFSCKRAQHFGLACEPLYREVLAELRPRSVRLSVYWSDVEEQPGVYDFSAIDRLLDLSQEAGVAATVTVGMKSQRYPEFWLPTWLRLAANVPPDGVPGDHPLVEAALFPYLDAAARHLGAHPAVAAIQVENEPFVYSRGHGNGWHIRREFFEREIATVRAADPGRHPIVVSHASWWHVDDTWRWILEHADVLAQSVYTKRQRGPWSWLYIFPYRIGPLTPDLPGQARAAEAAGKQLWITELQAEPYERPDIDVRRIPTDEARSFSAAWLEENVTLARRSGATRVYLWGVEWWAYLRAVRGEPELWEAARGIFGGAGGAARRADGTSR